MSSRRRKAPTQVYIEHYDLQPIDPQTNGPQVLYGLRYHTYIHKPGLTKMYHDQVGYWLWEPATGTVLHTLAIPRGQVAMASGIVAADADRFTLVATHGSLVNGIVSEPLHRARLHHARVAHRGRPSTPTAAGRDDQDTVLHDSRVWPSPSTTPIATR